MSTFSNGFDEPAHPPIGREHELSLLTAHVSAVAGGDKRAAVLVGAPGIGKTTILRACVRSCIERGFVVAAVRVPTGAGLPPRYPLGEMLAAFAASCGRLGHDVPEALARIEASLNRPSLRGGFPVALPQLADALEALGSQAPVAVLIDDYDSAPRETTELLLSALRVIETPVLFAATARAGSDGPSAVPEATADLWIDRVELAGLERSEVGELAARELGGPALPSLVEAIHARTGGNPLFIVEIVRGWQREGVVERTGTYWGTNAEPDQVAPGTLLEAIAAKIRRLGPFARQVAGALAVIGRDASFEELRAIARMDLDALVAALSELDASGVVTGDPALYRLAHPTHATALLAGLGPTRRAAVHQAAFEGLRLLGREVPATELAHHAVRALEPPADMRALLERAAEEADSVGGYEEAARWYGHLADHLSFDVAAAVAAWIRRAEATTHFDPARAIEDVNRALALATEPSEVARLLLTRAQARRVLGDLDAAMEDLKAATNDLTGDHLFRASHLTAALHGIRNELEAAESILRALAGDRDGAREVTAHLGQLAFERGEVEEAIRVWRQGIHLSERQLDLDIAHNLAWGLLLTGEWDKAAALLAEGIAQATRRGDSWNLVGLLANRARLTGWRGLFSTAFDCCAQARRVAARLGNPACVIDVLDALGSVLLENGDLVNARDALVQAVTLMATSAEVRETAATMSLLADALLRLDDAPGASHWTRQAKERNHGPVFWLAAADRVTALCLAKEGRYHEALELLKDCEGRVSFLPFERAQNAMAQVTVLRKQGRREQAYEIARRAHATYIHLGADGRAAEAGRIVHELEHRPRGRPRLAADSQLTPRETDVLRLLTPGMTNREIAERLGISERTVAKHVENMLSRTGFARRTQLAAWALTRKSDP